MSQTELKELHDTNQFLNKLKPILKNNNTNYLSTQTRTDFAGNQIIKGGNHKIIFLPISNEQSPNVATCNNIQINSESSDSDQEIITQNNINNQPFLNLKEKKSQKTQPLIINESRCCQIF